MVAVEDQEGTVVDFSSASSNSTAVVELKKKLLSSDADVADIERSNLIDLAADMERAFSEAQAIRPPLDPLSLVRLASKSATLPAIVNAIAVNVHGFGYRFEPVIDLKSSDSLERVRTAIILEREAAAEIEAIENDKETPKPAEEPTDQEVEERIEALRVQMRKEKAKAEAFFANVSRKFSYTRLCRKMEIDRGTTGYGVFEVQRDGFGKPSRMSYAPSWTFRALGLTQHAEVSSTIHATEISTAERNEEVQFRRFIQIYETCQRYFKEFGDPRVMSSKSGKFYKDKKALAKEEGAEVRPATEVLWYPLDSAESDVYGQICWSGCIPGVIGSREQAEVNLLFFRSKTIPPMVVLVSGGKLAKAARKLLEEKVRNEMNSAEDFHKVWIIEAESTGKGTAASGMPNQDRVKIEIKPLTQHIFKDALWQGYAIQNAKELGQAFRVPPLYRGDTEKINRATAKTTQEIVEQQVFGGMRFDFEFDINKTIMPDLGVFLWKFKLNTPENADAEKLADFIQKLSEGVLTVNEARQAASKLFHMELPPIDADWARMPIKQALAGMQPESIDEDGETTVKTVKIEIPQDEIDLLVERDNPDSPEDLTLDAQDDNAE